jgi:kynureninase
MESGVALAAEAGMAAAAAKARALGDLFIAALDLIGDPEVRLESPRSDVVPAPGSGGRGGHVTFHHPAGYALVQAMIAEGVVGDYREPGGARFGFSPLPLAYGDVVAAGRVLERVLGERLWDRERFRARATVT